MPRTLSILVCLLVLVATSARGGDPDATTRGLDLDAGLAPREGPTRVRWFFAPTDFSEAEAAVAAGAAGVERVAILTVFDDRWILEASADSLQRVQDEFGDLGLLAPDESGDPALVEARELVGADADFVTAADLEGDVSSTVAFLDSGCDTAHDDLGDPDENDLDGFPEAGDAADWLDATDLLAGELEIRIVGWHDVTDDLPLAAGPWDDHFHGTAMASAGFGSGRVDARGRSVAPEGRFVVVKTWNFEGRWERWASDFFLGVEWLIQNGERLRVRAAVVGTVWNEDHGFEAAVEALADAGILLIAPVGNSRASAGWPARVPEAFGVGAATKDGRVAHYSSRAPFLNLPPILDVVAPGGSEIVPDASIVVADNEPNDSYRGRTGTSIAAGIVGGAVSVVAEVARESGYPLPTGRDRVTWLTDLLNQTSVELAASEPEAAFDAFLDRGRADSFEGYGLIQVPAAVQAINNILWVGDRETFFLAAPTNGNAVWAARIPGGADVPTTLSLIPSSDVDADLFVFEDTGARLRLLGSSTGPGNGTAEAVELEGAPDNDMVVVARRVSGAGTVIFSSLQRFGPSSLWPRELRSRQRTQPVAADLDDDGTMDLVLTNTFSVDRRIHEFVVFDARGRTFRFFPRSVDSSPNAGTLTSPVVGVMNGRRIIAAGSDFGVAYGVSDSAQVLFATMLTQSASLTAPVLWEEGQGARLLFGGQTGLQVVTSTGEIENVVPLGTGITSDLAVGDLDDDGVEEIVAVTDDGSVHAVEIDGTPVPGWPLSLSGSIGAPVLVGRSGAPGVDRIVFAESTGSGDLVLHEVGPDGQPVGSGPHVLDRSGLPVLAFSPVAAARSGDGTVEVVLSGTLGSYFGVQIYRLWRLRAGTGVVAISDDEYSTQHLQGMLHFSRGLVLDEPRLAELSTSPGLEVMQTTLFDWKEEFVGNPRRYGSRRQVYQWRSDSPSVPWAIGPGHEVFPEVWGLSPVITDFEGDGYPDLVVVRDNRVYRAGARIRWTLDGMWGSERGGRRRTGCIDCNGPTFVSSPAVPRSLTISASPNPFNPRTVLSAELPAPGRLEWSVYDARGRKVRGWIETAAAPGSYRSVFEGVDDRGQRLSSGVYFVQLRHPSGTARARMVLVR